MLRPMHSPVETRHRATAVGYAAVLLVAAYARSVGIYRGLDAGAAFHPDEPKQVVATARALAGEYGTYEHKAAIDAYPLFVSRLDAWIIGAARAPLRAIRAFLAPDAPLPEAPAKPDLYRWTRGLRFVYGMAALALTLAIARGLGFSHRATLFAGLAMALCPLSYAVTHFSTGEVGMDLFGAAAVALLALHARRPRRLWLAASGFAVGWAFDSKFHGALIAATTAIYLTASAVARRGGLRRFAAEAFVSLAGFVAGVVSGTPQWIWDRKRYWRDLLHNLDFIKFYAVPPEVRALPATRRAWMSFESNLPKVLGSLGWTLALLGFAGLAFAIARALRARGAEAEDPAAARLRRLRAAVFAFPPIALAVSLAGKLMLQAIHFSNLAPFLALSAAFALSELWRTRRAAAQGGAVLLGAMAVLELGALTERELFFWRRDDVTRGVREMRNAFGDAVRVGDDRRGRPTANTLRDFNLEGDNPSGFRNRPHTVSVADGAWWNAAHIAPTPTTPLTPHGSWVYAHGPVLPRNDREFPAAPGRPVERHVVWHAPPGPAAFGLRAGRIPSLVEIEYGGARERVELEPHQQKIVTLAPRRWRTEPRARRRTDPVFLVPLSIRAVTGEVMAQALADPREIRHFRAFGGDAEALRELAADLPEREPLLDALSRTRFMESPPDWIGLLTPANARETLPGVGPLAAGRYRLLLDVEALAPDGRIEIELHDPDRRTPADDGGSAAFDLIPGLQRIEWRFAKRFAPYDGRLTVTAVAGACRVRGWTLAPDAEALYEDLRAMAAGGPPPFWCRRFDLPTAPPPRELPVRARFGAGGPIEIESLALPETLTPGRPFAAAARVRLRGPVRWAEHALYVRLVDAAGRTVWSFRPRIARGAYGETPAAPDQFTPPEDAPPGVYGVYVRLFNERTFLRQPLYSAAPGARVERQWVRAGEVRIAAP